MKVQLKITIWKVDKYFLNSHNKCKSFFWKLKYSLWNIFLEGQKKSNEEDKRISQTLIYISKFHRFDIQLLNISHRTHERRPYQRN